MISQHRSSIALLGTPRRYLGSKPSVRVVGRRCVFPQRISRSRELPSDPSSVRVYRDSLGHWYASFVVKACTELLPTTGRVIGIDWGVKEIATTTSDNHDLAHPQHGKGKAAKLGRYQRMMARRKPTKGSPPSKGYLEAKRKTAKVHKKVAPAAPRLCPQVGQDRGPRP